MQQSRKYRLKTADGTTYPNVELTEGDIFEIQEGTKRTITLASGSILNTAFIVKYEPQER